MSDQSADQPAGGTAIPRRTVLGLVLGAAFIAPLVMGAATSATYADSGHGGGGKDEKYDIPDDIGSTPWW